METERLIPVSIDASADSPPAGGAAGLVPANQVEAPVGFHSSSLQAFAALPTEVQDDVRLWHRALSALRPRSHRSDLPGITAQLRSLAREFHVSYQTARRKYYAWLDARGDWNSLVNRAKNPIVSRSTVNPVLIQTWKNYHERHQRKSAPAWRAFVRDFLSGRTLPGIGPEISRRHLPRGFSYATFMRCAPSKFELAAARQGRAAASQFRPLVFTTRKNLYVGSHYLFDDLWHDNFVNLLDTRQTGRPLEFHCLDLYSACKFAWGMKVRVQQPDGTNLGLCEKEMRFLLAYVLWAYGYDSVRGTILVLERGTATIREALAQLLSDLSGGKITCAFGGMQGDPAFIGQYAGRSKGNFRFKAALESHGNLVHNELDYLPAQTGMDVDRRPEQLHGLLKYNDALLDACSALNVEHPEIARLLQFPVLSFSQFQTIANEIYQRINRRTIHALEGWDDLCVPDVSSLKLRRLSPFEVHEAGRPRLTRLAPEAIALILSPDLATERTVANHLIAFTDREIQTDPIRFLATDLPDGAKVNAVVNPFCPDNLYCFDARGRFLSALPRWHSVDKADLKAVGEQISRAAIEEARLLRPVAARGRSLADARLEASQHNTRLLQSALLTPSPAEQLAQQLDSL